jgi:hypothetical protein
LPADEQHLLQKWRVLTPEDRKAIERVLDRMISPGSVHTPTRAYRASTGGETERR